MSFNIIHGDIAKVNTDAVVLPANPELLVGPGSSQAVFEAAGWEELTAACKEIGYCPLGSAVITPGFNLKSKNVIHAVCPRYIDGTHKEAELLYSAYQTSLQLAVDNGLKSISFPLLSAGNYMFPRGEALSIANRAIKDFLEDRDDDFYVQLVIYDKEVLRKHSRFMYELDRLVGRGNYESDELYMRVAEPSMCVGSATSLEDLVKNKEKSFVDLLNEYIIRSELTNPQVYKKAMISKQVFSKAISGQDVPKKNTILAIAVALELSIGDTEKLLMKAGYSLSDNNITDIVVRYFIERRKYDVMLINEMLFYYEEPLLGNVAC